MNIRPCSLGPGLSLESAKGLGRNFVGAGLLPERMSTIALSASGPIGKWRTDFLFDYDIFPKTLMRFDAEWQKATRAMIVGDVIVQRAIVPPIGFGFCLEFAVRICSLIQEAKRLGFAYETLSGHVESGVSEFYFEAKESGLYFTIHTFSEPGHWSSRFASRLFTLPYQAWCTRRALAHVRDRFHQENRPAADHPPQTNPPQVSRRPPLQS